MPTTKIRCATWCPGSVGGVPLPGSGVNYVQAQFAAIPQHRVTGGVGLIDLLPGLDMDIFAGGMFRTSQTFGTTTATVQSYWVGAGLTWHFGRGAIEHGDWTSA